MKKNSDGDEKKEIIVTRKVTLYPKIDKEGKDEKEIKAEIDRAYNFIRNGQEIQAQMSNMYISALYEAKKRGASKDEIRTLKLAYGKVPTEDNIYAGVLDLAKYPKGVGVPSGMLIEADSRLDRALKDGLKYGRVSLPSFKCTMPMFVQGGLLFPECDSRHRGQGFRHGFETYEEIEKSLLTDACPDVWLNFASGLVYKVDFGTPKKSHNLRVLFCRIFSGEYKICNSHIRVKDGKIELLLSIKQPIQEHFHDENVTVGVDLGIAVPAMCALNNNFYKREMVGSADELVGFRIKKKKMYERIQSNIKNAKGGHGRKRKLRKLDGYNSYILNYARTYNHKISKAVVEFAVKNNAAYINLEDLSGIKQSGAKKNDENKDEKEERRQFLLRNWSVYDLQKDIEYKAEREGIKVRYINPEYTSQTCSVCGQKGLRPDQKTFTCINPECKCKKIYEEAGNTMKRHFADFNAARNIAMSTDFVDAADEEEKKGKKKAGRKKTEEESA